MIGWVHLTCLFDAQLRQLVWFQDKLGMQARKQQFWKRTDLSTCPSFFQWQTAWSLFIHFMLYSRLDTLDNKDESVVGAIPRKTKPGLRIANVEILWPFSRFCLYDNSQQDQPVRFRVLIALACLFWLFPGTELVILRPHNYRITSHFLAIEPPTVSRHLIKSTKKHGNYMNLVWFN